MTPLGPPQPGAGVLLLHGYSGTPFELHPLTSALRQQGYPCAVPLLAGHGGGLGALARSSADDWLHSAERALLDLYDQLLQQHPQPRLAVVGLSMGGMLALRLAQRYPPLVRALVVMAAPLALFGAQERLIRTVVRGPAAYLALPKLLGSDVRDREARRQNPANWAMPLRPLPSLVALMETVRQHLPDLYQPALLAHGAHDRTVPPACLGQLAARIGTPRADLSLLWLADSAHLLPIDVEREVLIQAVLRHLGRYLASAEPPAAP